MKKRINKNYITEFKQEAATLVTEQGYSVPKAAAASWMSFTKNPF